MSVIRRKRTLPFEVEEAVREIREVEHHQPKIHFTLDGKKYETCLREATPNQIIADFGKQDPAPNYWVEIQGTHKISYQGKGDLEIKLRDGSSWFATRCAVPGL